MQGNALFSGKIYTVDNIFTRPPVVTVATNFKSALTHFILLKMESNAKCKYETLCHWIEPFTFSIDNAAAVGSKSS